MNGSKLIAIALLVTGVLAVAYGGFSYTEEHTPVKVGPVELKVEERKDVNVPLWAGIAVIAAGGVALALSSRR